PGNRRCAVCTPQPQSGCGGFSFGVVMRSGAGSLALAAIVAVSFLPLLAEPSRGKELFEKRCTGCHSLDRVKVGPPLRGVVGRRAGSFPAFPYSDALRNTRFAWDPNSLDQWLTDPDAFLPENDMAFRVANRGERAEIIAYLAGLSAK